MDSSKEIPRDALDSRKLMPQICEQEERLDIPSTSTSETNPIMPLNAETICEQIDVVMNDIKISSSAGKKQFNSIQSINAFVQSLCSRIKKYNENLLQNKVSFETLSNNPNLSTLSEKELVVTLSSLVSSNQIIIDEKKEVILQLLDVEESLIAISKKLDPHFYEDPEVIDALQLLKPSLRLIFEEQETQTSLFTEIKRLSAAISNKPYFISSTVKQLLYTLQSQNESADQDAKRKSEIIVLRMVKRALDPFLEQLQSSCN